MADDKTIVPFPVKWGFSNWNGKGSIINARVETVFEKRMFSKPLQNRRCVIPSSGFYEWSHEEGKTKDKFLIRSLDSKVLYMAGITDTFVDSGGSRLYAFAILTTSANASVSSIHNRMPVILTQNEIERWILTISLPLECYRGREKVLKLKG